MYGLNLRDLLRKEVQWLESLAERLRLMDRLSALIYVRLKEALANQLADHPSEQSSEHKASCLAYPVQKATQPMA